MVAMRCISLCVSSLALCLFTAPALAESTSAPAKGAETGKGDTGQSNQDQADTGKTDARKSASDKGEAGKGGEGGKAEDKKPSVTGGYSWSDKPAKGKSHHTYKKKKLDPNAPIATYPGFRMLPDGSSQVWVRVNRKVSVTSAATSGLPTFVLMGAVVPTHNNTNPLVTTWFETPLARARLKNDAAGAQLTLELREQVSVKHRVVDGPGGSMLLYVDLPKPSKSYGDTWENERTVRPSKTNSAVLPAKGSKGGSKSGPQD
jgi:hypothetical protein